eukprot:2068069-Pyramimonas_sp.AAC.1
MRVFQLQFRYNAVQCNAMRQDATQCNATQCNANATQCNATVCNATQCNAMQYSAAQRNAVHYKAMQCAVTQRVPRRVAAPQSRKTALSSQLATWQRLGGQQDTNPLCSSRGSASGGRE